jgi:sugar lactone lactonase YvrE
MGPLDQARLADPRALALADGFTLFAGGATGTVQRLRDAPGWLDVVAGRYPQPGAIDHSARYGGEAFGAVGGVAYDPLAGVLYLSETTAHRLHMVRLVDPDDAGSWTIETVANSAGSAGFADGAAATARFRGPTGLYLDAAAHILYVADTGNHVIRAVDLAGGVGPATVSTVAGIPEVMGFFGDGLPASAAMLHRPQALVRCANGDLFVADTGNHRVRRIEAATGLITTVLGDGVAASSGQGAPARDFPVDAPLGLDCDYLGNLYVTSSTAIRLVVADATGAVDGSGEAQTIFGAPPRDDFPASVSRCLAGLAVVDETTLQVTDSCTGMLIALRRQAR